MVLKNLKCKAGHKAITLRRAMLLSFLSTIVIFWLFTSLLLYYIIEQYVIREAQRQAINDLKTARAVFSEQVNRMKTLYGLIEIDDSLPAIRKELGLDYLFKVSDSSIGGLRSNIVRKSIEEKKAVCGIRIIGNNEAKGLGGGILKRSKIDIRPTPMAKPTEKRAPKGMMAIECARPFYDKDHTLRSIVYGGAVINGNLRFAGRIADVVYENRTFDGKPIGTVTIFQDDVRISTNVVDASGSPAIGTRVSDEVYKKVVGQGDKWLDRAFVVTDWYLTAYEPIYDIEGSIVGMLYVGTLEKPFTLLKRSLVLVSIGILSCAAAVVIILSWIIGLAISNPVTEIRDSTRRIAEGDMEYRLEAAMPIKELGQLAVSFNTMAERLQEREERLEVTNKKLLALNKNYIEMVGFISHELKGILGSVIMNVYSIKGGFLGPLNAAQKKAIDLTSESLDYFEEMVKDYLDLSRIEKGELEIEEGDFDIALEILKPVLGYYEKLRQERSITVKNSVRPGISVTVDRNLTIVVFSNLVSNAIKYGKKNGFISIDAAAGDDHVRIEVYNEGEPIRADEAARLFKKFYRPAGPKIITGTGLGLFIAKEIVEKEGGRIWVEPKESGNLFIVELKRSIQKGGAV
ncbi:cache domain-containing protein [Candidatus Omnitrophota bacterium]